MKYIFIFLIRVYQIAISPFLGKSCMFEPTCSEYSRIAFERHGVFKGFMLSAKRILRCHPWQKDFGVDPVPSVDKNN